MSSVDLDFDVISVEESIEIYAYEFRHGERASEGSMRNWRRAVKSGITWLKFHAPDSYILKEDFSDITG